MPSVIQWAWGIVVGFLVLQFGNLVLPELALGGLMNAFLSLVLLVAAVMLAWRVAHRKGD